MSRIGRSVARHALRLYPATWQQRYGAEVSGLISGSDSSLADALDLAQSAVSEHLKGGFEMRFNPAHRHPGAFALTAAMLVAPTLVVVVASLLGHELGIAAIATVTDPLMVWIGTVGVLDLFLVLAPLVAFMLAALPLLDVRLERDGEPALAVRIRAVTMNVVVCLVAFSVGAALVWHLVVESVVRISA